MAGFFLNCIFQFQGHWKMAKSYEALFSCMQTAFARELIQYSPRTNLMRFGMCCSKMEKVVASVTKSPWIDRGNSSFAWRDSATCDPMMFHEIPFIADLKIPVFISESAPLRYEKAPFYWSFFLWHYLFQPTSPLPFNWNITCLAFHWFKKFEVGIKGGTIIL